MIFIFFTIIIFIALLIIAGTLIKFLITIDIKLNKANNFILELNTKLSEVMILCREISEQILELAPEIAEKISSIRNFILWELAERLVSFVVFLAVNKKMYNKFKIKKLKKLFSWV